MNNFIRYTGTVMPLDLANVDTDAIIPKQFLSRVVRDDLGKYLFFNWRFNHFSSQELNGDFVLNKSCYKGSTILLTRENFGCGSSREHAVWALIDYGFKIIIAPNFADIFFINSVNNKLLLINLSTKQINQLFKICTVLDKVVKFTIDLLEQKIFIGNTSYSFNISIYYRNRILYDIDHIEQTMIHENEIMHYEKKQLCFLI